MHLNKIIFFPIIFFFGERSFILNFLLRKTEEKLVTVLFWRDLMAIIFEFGLQQINC